MPSVAALCSAPMATLRHEVWVDGEGLPMVCLAGPLGDDARRLQEPGARLAWTFDAGSHFDAMTVYYSRMGWGAYTSENESDREAYPDSWAATQRDAPG